MSKLLRIRRQGSIWADPISRLQLLIACVILIGFQVSGHHVIISLQIMHLHTTTTTSTTTPAPVNGTGASVNGTGIPSNSTGKPVNNTVISVNNTTRIIPTNATVLSPNGTTVTTPAPPTEECACIPKFFCTESSSIVDDPNSNCTQETVYCCRNLTESDMTTTPATTTTTAASTTSKPSPPTTPAPAATETAKRRCGVPYVVKNYTAYPDMEGQAIFGEYPWMAILMGKEGNYVSSGVLLDKQHVLTTAHKLPDLIPTSFKVRLGEWNMAKEDEPNKFVEIPVEKWTKHPAYNSLSMLNDIAVLRLATPIGNETENPHINPVCLPLQGASFSGKRRLHCYISSFGKEVVTGNDTNQILREGQVMILPGQTCQDRLRSSVLGKNFNFNQESFICGDGELTDYDSATCEIIINDPGSPLVCQLGGEDGPIQIVGISSWGLGCKNTRVPIMYMNVPNYVNWINSVIDKK